MLSKREVANLMRRDTPMQPDEFNSILDSHEELRAVLEEIALVGRNEDADSDDLLKAVDLAVGALKSC